MQLEWSVPRHPTQDDPAHQDLSWLDYIYNPMPAYRKNLTHYSRLIADLTTQTLPCQAEGLVREECLSDLQGRSDITGLLSIGLGIGDRQLAVSWQYMPRIAIQRADMSSNIS